MKRQLTSKSGQDEYSHWAEWFFANRDLRTISPSSVVTVPAYVRHSVEESTLKSLREAIRLAPNNAKVLARLAQQLLWEKSGDKSSFWEEAALLSERAVVLAPK